MQRSRERQEENIETKFGHNFTTLRVSIFLERVFAQIEINIILYVLSIVVTSGNPRPPAPHCQEPASS